jgi:amidase
VKGYDSSIGFVALANKPHKDESEVVKMLRRLGAVLYCKTNVPTAMMMAETVNNLLGRTVLPIWTILLI